MIFDAYKLLWVIYVTIRDKLIQVRKLPVTEVNENPKK